MKYGKRFFLISIFFALIFNVAYAETFLDKVSFGITDITHLIKIQFVQKLEDDFCRQYILAISDGRWSSDEFRTKLGKKICTSYDGRFVANGKIKESLHINFNDAVQDPQVKFPVNLPKNSVTSTEAPIKIVVVPGENEIINLTNDNRAHANLSGLKENSLLNKIAEMRVDDMFDRQYFEHTTPTGETVSQISSNAGYHYITIGENIALGNFQGAKGLVEAWMASPGHRANILNQNYTQIGVASKNGVYKGQTVTIAAQVFGRPLSDCKEPSKEVKNNIEKYKNSALEIFSNMQTIKDSLSTLSSLNQTAYNSKVAEYNSQTRLYNDLVSEIKKLTSQYNNEVTIFNDCVKK